MRLNAPASAESSAMSGRSTETSRLPSPMARAERVSAERGGEALPVLLQHGRGDVAPAGGGEGGGGVLALERLLHLIAEDDRRVVLAEDGGHRAAQPIQRGHRREREQREGDRDGA